MADTICILRYIWSLWSYLLVKIVLLPEISFVRHNSTHIGPGGAAQGGMGGRPPPQKLAVYETKLAKIRLPKIQKIALCRVRPPKMKHVQPPLLVVLQLIPKDALLTHS